MAIGVVILGAGTSSRMGCCKGLLPWREHTVLEEVAQVFKNKKLRVAVLGEDTKVLAPRLMQQGYTCVVNEQPQLGQGESLRLGVEQLHELSKISKMNVEGIICAVGDQPLLRRHDVERLVHAFREEGEQDKRDKLIIVPVYGREQRRGNPVLFGSFWLTALTVIKGDEGGRTIINGSGLAYVRTVEMGVLEVSEGQEIHGGLDIDTPTDYHWLYKLRGKL